MLMDYLPVFFQVVIAVGFAAVTLLVSVLAGQRGRRNLEKDTAYECGKDPQGNQSARFSVKFYMIAMLFILFDIETVFFFLWAVVYRDQLSVQGLSILFSMMFFIGILFVGFAYELKKKALDWVH